MRAALLPFASLLLATSSFVAAALGAEPPGTLFMSPGAGLLVTMPGIDGVTAIVDANAGVAEVNIEAVQSLVGNTVTQQGGDLSVDFTDSGNFLRGVLSVNQEAGNMNQQANIRALTVVDAGGGLGMIDIDINTSQELRGNTLTLIDPGPSNVTIENSFNNGTGVVGINQAAGNLNQQLTVVAIGIGLNVGPDTIQLGDAALGQIGTDQDNSKTLQGPEGTGQNTLADSFNNFTGIAQVSQVTGDMNRVTQVIGVSVTSMGAP
jgi:hypothetical protein